MLSSTVENYLKRILLLSERESALVPMGLLASALAVAPGTATTMVKSLAAGGYLVHRPRQGVRLTRRGRRIALDVLRRHRLVETFLVDVLKMDWTAVHVEAERLEHAISPAVLDRLDALLGHPSTDPHGDPIPGPQGSLRAPLHASLATCPLGERLGVTRITDQSTPFLHLVRQKGLLPGAVIRVIERDLTAGVVLFRRGRRTAESLGWTAASRILVTPLETPTTRDPGAFRKAGSGP